MKILIYGAGVIGSLYAVQFFQAGYDTSIYARGERLKTLRNCGLQFQDKTTVKIANVTVMDKVDLFDFFDYIFLTVREEQAETALKELRDNVSPTIVTMVNTTVPYSEWEKHCGQGRILPAFPGAGGSIDDGVLNATLTPRIIQPTTFGEIGGVNSERQQKLSEIFKRSHIPYQIVPNMYFWQLSHLGLVVPLADAYYLSQNPKQVYRDKKIMKTTAFMIKRNFRILARQNILSSLKFYIFRYIPLGIMQRALSLIYKSDFGNKFMYQHSMKAPEEMHRLHQDYYRAMQIDE